MNSLKVIILVLLWLCKFNLFSQVIDTLRLNNKPSADFVLYYSEQTNKLQVKCSSEFIPYKLFVYNIAGTLIYSTSKFIDEQFPIMEYYVELSKGMYVINIETKLKTYSKKIIVNR